ncbi:hypothetical protein TTHERM_000580368 (macronuclear) [Tetrahymena thermophila SB210]|uniref:Uncharacterized protein n=1 Tax=Tetrahymena thermophila (strain SB210) TaxID=312017 RepID=W7X7X2_TETTS|nr:hypothetical protein TTHERM_000580368 [Tetrahymena thermophila SB210]EWS72523.1 hypothetical protein TTHERM_000580368 [Tetrahymena thermophila SB210]|eukprot:XP_012654959.1 hypothetical protein TTHERM_000580368 [Tetrahymena thermophila SB210]
MNLKAINSHIKQMLQKYDLQNYFNFFMQQVVEHSINVRNVKHLISIKEYEFLVLYKMLKCIEELAQILLVCLFCSKQIKISTKGALLENQSCILMHKVCQKYDIGETLSILRLLVYFLHSLGHCRMQHIQGCKYFLTQTSYVKQL